MDPSVVSATAALVGASMGGLASFGSSWMTQRTQLRDQRIQIERSRREQLFSEFINEASRLYADALTHEKNDVCDLVRLYALVGRIRLMSAPNVVQCAAATLNTIIDTYLAPNRDLHELRVIAASGEMNFLQDFSEACRAELAGIL